MKDWLQSANLNDVLVLDCEASGAIRNKAHPFTPANKLVCVGTLWRGVYCHHWIEHSNEPYGSQLQAIRKLVEAAKLIVAFNAKYDLHWIHRYLPDLFVDRVWDLQLAEFILQAQMVTYPDLDTALFRNGIPGKLDVVKLEFWDKGIDTDQIPKPILLEYTERDVRSEYELFKKQCGQLRGPQRALFDLHCDDLLVLQEMEFNGLRYKTDESLRLGAEVETELVQVKEELNGIVGRTDLNWNSGDHLSAVLYGGTVHLPVREKTERRLKNGTIKHGERWGVLPVIFPSLCKPGKRTECKPTSQWSNNELERINAGRVAEGKKPFERVYETNEAVLKSHVGNKRVSRLIELILKLSGLEKLRGTYYFGIPALIEKQGWEQDTIHGQINQCVAVTGRTASSKPNLQNFDTRLKALFYSRYT